MEIRKCEFKKNMLPVTFNWLQDIELKTLTNTPDFTKEEQDKWFATIKDNNSYKIWAIYSEELPIGVFGIKNICNNEGEYWGYIGEKEYWGKGIGKWMIDESITISKGMGLKKLYLKVMKSNDRAIRLYTKSGFNQIDSDSSIIKMEKEIE